MPEKNLRPIKTKTVWLVVTKTCANCNLTAFKLLSKPYTPLDEFAALDKINEGTNTEERMHRSLCTSVDVFELTLDGATIKTETFLDF